MFTAPILANLPSAVLPYLKYQLDRDNHVNRDLKEIANHMEKLDSNLASYLKLTETDIKDVNHKYNKDPALQR